MIEQVSFRPIDETDNGIDKAWALWEQRRKK